MATIHPFFSQFKLLEVGFSLESILTGKGMLASFNNGLKPRGGL